MLVHMANKLDELTAKILQEVGYKEPVAPVVEEMAFFQIHYSLDSDEPGGGYYSACYQQTWDEEFNDLISMDFVYGETVKEVLAELCKALGRPPLAIGAHEWELGYDERED
tara:strand:- start:1443 stop:1775 length:333 start_codon:yes stop_codon:yes gene_type:complete